MDEEKNILAKTIYGEAKEQGLNVMEAIANVVMNRVKRAQNYDGNYWWGNTVKNVCLKPFQFPCWGQNRVCATPSQDNPIFQMCERIAVRAVKGLLPDNTKGATHYHKKNIHPRWAYAAVPCAEIGDYLFYDAV